MKRCALSRFAVVSTLVLGSWTSSGGSVDSDEAEVDRAETPVRGLRVDRVELEDAAWLPEGSIGGWPMDRLAPLWPRCLVVLEVNFNDPAEVEVVDGLVRRSGRFDRRLRLLVVDRSSRDLSALDWFVWRQGWLDAPLAFAPEAPRPYSKLSGWRVFSAWVPGLDGREESDSRRSSRAGTTPILSGDERDGARAIARAVDEHFEALDRAVKDMFSSRIARAVAECDLDPLLSELDKLSKEIDRARERDGPLAGLAFAQTQVTLGLALAQVGFAQVELSAEARLAFRMGQTVRGQLALKQLRSVVDDDSKLDTLTDEVEELYGKGRKAFRDGDALEKLLSDTASADLATARSGLEAFVEREDLAAPVEARARHYLELITRAGPEADGADGSE